MNKRRLIYLTDAILIPLFVLSLYSGIQLHITGHGTEHDIWHNWAVFHTIDSLLFTTFGIIHIKSHWFWYKGLKNKKTGTQNTKETKYRPTAHIHLYMGHYYRYMVVVFCRRSKFAVWEITLQGRSTNGYLRAPAHSETIASPKKWLMSEHLSPYEYSPYLTEISKGELKYQMISLHKGKAQVKYILSLIPQHFDLTLFIST